MEPRVKTLYIRNYKSIKELVLHDCERINVFVGEPNTGKSNILEALDLSYLSWMIGMNQSNEKAGKEQVDLKKFFRIKDIANLYHEGNVRKPIQINSPDVSYCNYSLDYKTDILSNKNFFRWHAVGITDFDNEFKLINKNQSSYGSPIVPFRYKNDTQFHDIGNYLYKLMPPFGNNLAKVIFHNRDMRALAKNFAEQYNFDFKIDAASDEISIQLRLNEGLVYTLPFQALPDTFRRILFYIASVKHNNASLITLDEPDTHAFPNYVSLLADEIIEQKNNQFFITTHNPYLFGQLIEQTPKGELSVYVCGFNRLEKSTFARKLSDEDLSELVGYGVDIFFNLNPYLNEDIQHNS